MHDIFKKAFSLFGSCHAIYNGNACSDEEINQLGIVINNIVTKLHTGVAFLELNIEDFMSFYRATFPHASVIPKMHLMEDHMIPWFKKWQVGFGAMGLNPSMQISTPLNGPLPI